MHSAFSFIHTFQVRFQLKSPDCKDFSLDRCFFNSVYLVSILWTPTHATYFRNSGVHITPFVNVFVNRAISSKSVDLAWRDRFEALYRKWFHRCHFNQILVNWMSHCNTYETHFSAIYGVIHSVNYALSAWHNDIDFQRLSPTTLNPEA